MTEDTGSSPKLELETITESAVHPCNFGGFAHAGTCTAPIQPRTEGAFAPTMRCKHGDIRPISHTLEGPLKVLTSCANCGKIEVVAYSPRLRKQREGFSDEGWANFMRIGKERADALR